MGDALFVLGGWPRKNGGGFWRSSLFDAGGIGDRLRVEAAALLYHGARQRIFITGGNRKLAHVPGVPCCAAVMKRELIELGVPEADVLEEIHAGNTYEQLQYIKTVISRFVIGRLRIVSNRYHLPRIEAFLTVDQELNGWRTSGRITPIAAEDVLLQREPARWEGLITEAYRSDAMLERIAQEQQGVLDIRAGTYRW